MTTEGIFNRQVEFEEVLLELRDMSKIYSAPGSRKTVTALENLNLKVSRGEFLAILGPSGCGKSTLLDIIAGFSFPSSGLALHRGQRISGPGHDRVMVFQDHALFPWYTALGNVAYGLRRQGLTVKAAEGIASRALERMGLSDFINAFPCTLSGGMKQRVALARALVLDPEILLMDEPFASLDAPVRVKLQDDLLTLQKEQGWTVVFVTHTVSEAVYLADRVVIIGSDRTDSIREQSIDLRRPRRRQDPDFLSRVDTLSASLGQEAFNGKNVQCLCSMVEDKPLSFR